MITELVVIQPTNFCNLNCSYCYLPGRSQKGLMSDEVLEASMRCIFNSVFTIPQHSMDVLEILWHAGEPLVAGIDFYQNAIKKADQYNLKKIQYRMSVQTNGTLVDQNWCELFVNNNFHVGISLDGPEFIHDASRKNWQGRGSFKNVMKGFDVLAKNNIPLNALSVLTRNSLDYPDEIYNFFKEIQCNSVAFNIEEVEGIYQNSTLCSKKENNDSIEKYKKFMSRLYDLWLQDENPLRIREFEILFEMFALKKHHYKEFFPKKEACAFLMITINKNGDITTFSPEMASGTATDPNLFHIGNILEIKDFEELTANDNFKKQLNSIKQGVIECAKSCDYFEICGGGSPSNKFYEHGTFSVTETMFCRLSCKTLADVLLDKLKEVN